MRPIGNNAKRTGESNPAWRPPMDRFFDRVGITENSDCLFWKGFINHNGYPKFTIGSRVVRAHRFIYEWCIGPIPNGMELDHLCRNRNCVNPSHLEAVTRRENLLRGNTFARENSEKTACIKGHPFIGRNVMLTRDGKRKCRACATIRDHIRRSKAATPAGLDVR